MRGKITGFIRAGLLLIGIIFAIGAAGRTVTERGKLGAVGALTGATAGAIMGSVVGYPLVGAAIGTGLGLSAGALFAGQLNQLEYSIRRPFETTPNARTGARFALKFGWLF